MTFFNPNAPLLSRKPSIFEAKPRPGQVYLHWQVGQITLLSTYYTRLDQACFVWGVISAVIFLTAQFLPVSWYIQSIWWSVLTLIGIVVTVVLTPRWIQSEGRGWMVNSWIGLMMLGLIITDLSLFLGWGEMLMNLCSLWLGLVALGYLLTGIGMHSRTLIIMAAIHWLSIGLLPYVGGWQFLATGLLMGISSIALAELQWDSHGTCGDSFVN